MNRTYRQVWNRALRTLQVASEIARPRGAASGNASSAVIRRHPLALACAAALAMGSLGFALPALATPCAPSATQVCGTTGTTGANGAGAAGQAGAAGSTIYPKFSNPTVNGGPGGNGLVGASGGNGGVGGPGGTPGSTASNANSIEGGVGGTGGAGNGGTGGAGGYGGKGSDWGYSSTGAFIYGKGGAGGNGAAGGAGGNGGAGGVGGNAVNGSFTLTNTGTLAGGAGGVGGSANGGAGGSGGQGGYSPNGANDGFNNSLQGGYPGKAGAGNNGGTGGQGGNGGSAASGTGFALTNAGALRGGAGGVGGSANGGKSGYYFGGSGQYNLGAHGGNGGHGGAAGNGGAGVSGSGFTLVNTGSIAGGVGGTASNATHGNGYARIFNASGGSVFQAVSRFAGRDGTAGAIGYGGAGVVSTGGASIVTSGSIAGGRAAGGAGAQAAAVQLSGGGNTLTLEHGYSFTGVVTSAGGDTLALGGGVNDSFNLDQLGAEFQGFNNFAKTGTSTWTVTQSADQNAHTNGPWSITGGTLEVASSANPGSGQITVDNGLGQGSTLEVDGGATLANHIVLNNGGALTNAGKLDDATDAYAVESDTGGATINNTGSISGTGNTIELFNGGTVTNAVGGTITSTAANGQNAISLSGAGTLTNDGTINGDVLMDPSAANGVTLGIGSAINGNLNIGANAGSTLTLTGAAGTQDYSQAVTGTTTFSGGLVKDDAGTWVIGSGDLSPVTSVTVNAGTLQVGAATAPATLTTGSLSVASGATLASFGGVDAALTTIAAGGTLNPGAAGAIGSLTLNGNLDLLGDLAIGINGTGAGDFDLLNVLGSAAFGTGTAFNFAFGNGFGGAANDTFQFFNANSFTDFGDIGSNFACSGLTAGLTCSLSDAGDHLLLTLNGAGGGNGGGGNNGGGNGGATNVPEPGDLGMLGLGLVAIGGLVVFDRRRRAQIAAGADRA